MSKATTDRQYIQNVRKKLALGFGLPILGCILLVVLMAWLLQYVRAEEKHANGVMLTINAAWVKGDLQARIARSAVTLPAVVKDLEYSQLDRSDQAVRPINTVSPGLVLVFAGADLGTHLSFSPDMRSNAAALIRQKIGKQVSDRLLLGRGGVLGPFKLDDTSDNGYIAVVSVGSGAQGVHVGILDLSALLRASLPLSVTENMDVYITQAESAEQDFDINNPRVQFGNSLASGLNQPSTTRVARPYEYVSDLELDGLTLQLRFYGTHKGYRPSLNIWINISALLIFCSILLNLFLLWRDSRRRLEVEAKLREEKLFRESMQDSMAVGLRVWDLSGVIRYVNPAFCNMVGYSPVELIGVQQPLPYWPAKREDEYRRIVQDVIAGLAPPEGFETVYQHKNGQLIDVLIVEAPLKDGKGEHTGWMSSVIDITDRKRSEALIEQQREKLEAASRFALVGEVASNIAHELNQPLATMVSFAQAGMNLTQKEGAPENKYAELFQRLRDQAQRAGKVVGTVQNLVRKRKAMRETIAVEDLIESIRFMVTSTALQHNVRLHFKIDDPATLLHVDRIMVEQAILNLVKNASEAFTAAQRIRNVWIGAQATAEGFEFSVRDDGPGLSVNTSEKMFGTLVSTKPDGLGLGLSLCRSVAEAHGGRLKAESMPIGGTCFTMDLPMAVKESMEGDQIGTH